MPSIFARKFGDWAFGQKDEQSLAYVRFTQDKIGQKVHNTKLAGCLSLECLADWNDPIEKITVYREGKITSRRFHAFVLIKTKQNYYTIERWTTFVSLQTSTFMDDVVFFDKARKRSPIRETCRVGQRKRNWGRCHPIRPTFGKKTLWAKVPHLLPQLPNVRCHAFQEFQRRWLETKEIPTTLSWRDCFLWPPLNAPSIRWRKICQNPSSHFQRRNRPS